MSPKQISFLTSHAEGAWSANQQRHFEGKPFEADITAMPFYGETTGEQARLRASAEAMESLRSALTRSRPASPSKRPEVSDSSKAAGTSEVADDRPSATIGAPAAPSLPSPAKKKHRPNALSFLDPDSPAIITTESITRVVAEAASRQQRTEHVANAMPLARAATPPPDEASLADAASRTPSIDSDSSVSTSTSTSSSPVQGPDPDSDAATSPETSDNGDNGDDGDDGDAGSPTPKPTPTAGVELRMPDFSSIAANMSVNSSLTGKASQSIDSEQGRPASHSHLHPQAHTHLRTQSQAKAHVAKQQRKYRAYRYGTPEMPRGKANLPHLPPSALNPRVPASGHVKHLPRAEKLPLTGYELLASELSSHSSHIMKFRRGSMGAVSIKSSHSTRSTHSNPGSNSGSSAGSMGAQYPIKPLYRKFEALNHRILLHLQDELSELEEQLHRLDTADTQTRRLQNSFLPASRRAEVLAGGELQWHKADILGKIGYKLGQYNHVLSSFTETQHLASPSLSDINDYRSYLDTQQPIAEIETRFLDATDDLVTLETSRINKGPSSGLDSPSSSSSGSEESLSPSYLQTLSEDALDPMGRRRPLFHTLCTPPSPAPSSKSDTSLSSAPSSHATRPATAIFDKECVYPSSSDVKGAADDNAAASLMPAAPVPTSTGDFHHLVVATAVAVLVPVLTFALIPDFVGRMAVVLLVAFTVFGVQVQAGTVRITALDEATPSQKSGRDLLYCAAVYAAVMAVVASVCA